MNITGVEFGTIDWESVPPVTTKGERGTVTQRTFSGGNVRVRRVDYSPGYLADHWCERGHVVLVLAGELITELQDGRTFTTSQGMSYQVADGASSHRSRTDTGAKLFIVD